MMQFWLHPFRRTLQPLQLFFIVISLGIIFEREMERMYGEEGLYKGGGEGAAKAGARWFPNCLPILFLFR